MQFDRNYDRKLLVLERQHDANATVNSFTINLGGNYGNYGEFKDVVAFDLISFEITNADGDTSFNTITPGSVYMVLNDYSRIVTGISTLPAVFARITVTSSTNPAYFVDYNPLTYIVDPLIGKLSKLKVTLLTSTGQQYNVNGNNVIVTLAVYTNRNKDTRL
jgi:hypothetical protein